MIQPTSEGGTSPGAEQSAQSNTQTTSAFEGLLEGTAEVAEQHPTATASEALAQVSSEPRAFPSIPGYRVEEEVGRGGMGVVYRAMQLAVKRTVAIKMMLTGR